MTEFTDGTAKGKTLSLVELEKRLETLTNRLDALSNVKNIPVATPNNYVNCVAYQVGNVVSVYVVALNIPTGNDTLITGLPKPITGFIQSYALHKNEALQNVRVCLTESGELINWYSLFSGAIQSGNELQFQFCYIAKEV